MTTHPVERIIVAHPSHDVRRELDGALRRARCQAAGVFEANTPEEAARLSIALCPQVVVLDVGSWRARALGAVEAIVGPDWAVIGIHDPLAHPLDDEYRARLQHAGVSVLLPLPVGDLALADALRSVHLAGDSAPEGRAITFISHKGGVGKTTLAVNCALAFAQSGPLERDVVLFDGVLRMGNAAAFLGLRPACDTAPLATALLGSGEQQVEAFLTHDPVSGLALLASPEDPSAWARAAPLQLATTLVQLRRRFSLTVIDGPSYLDLDALTLLDQSERIYVVTEAITPTVLGTATYLRLLESEGFAADRVRLIVSRHSSFAGNLQLDLVSRYIGREPDYVIPYERAAVVAAKEGVPLFSRESRARKFADQIRALVKDELGVTEPLQGRAPTDRRANWPPVEATAPRR